ncbi:DUF4238 domain-containing protein [Pedobacter paludis]|uniref:DUF4238 domain-containing protein n=1 Tax=Pedobacter paludis TaxID=2203212 RepID=A0A317F0H2_9SPHI|nr:DUF4238 domain-containing protein [Pedobacter paludis]PWS32624.1 hypothetical protein DF947_06005 [Pedobacter paludis]
MSELKKRQHYVWRHYLKSWADDDQIWAFLKDQKKLIRSNLMGVAQERYFYQLEEFDKEEEKLLYKLVVHMSHPSVKELNLDFFRLYTSHYKLNEQLKNSPINSEAKAILQKEIDILEKNLMEDVHSKMEASGNLLLSVIDSKNYRFLEDEQALYETMLYLFFQYVRTKKMKKQVLEGFTSTEHKFWNVISHVMATTLCRIYSFSKDLNFTFLENSTDIRFLTCDQPVLNLLADMVDETGSTNEIELYYPLSPTLALRISFTARAENWIIARHIDDNEVDYLNKIVAREAHTYVFAEHKNDISAYFE